MKKLIAVIACLGVFLGAEARVGIIPYFDYGYNMQVYSVENGTSTHLNGFNFGTGLKLEVGLSKLLTMNLGLNYFQNRVNNSTVEQSVSVDLTEIKNFLQVPLLFNIYSRQNKTGFYFGLGPKLNIFLGGKIKGEASVSGVSASASVDLDKDTYNTFGAVLAFNMGYQAPFGLRVGAVFDVLVSDMYSGELMKENYRYLGAQIGWRF